MKRLGLLLCAAALLVMKSGEFTSPDGSLKVSSAGRKVQGSSRQGTVQSLPAGMTPLDWQSIRAAHADAQMAFQPVASGWQAGRANFDQRGVSVSSGAGDGWSWGLELASYGIGQRQQPITGEAMVTTTGGRLGYHWDDRIEEWYQSDRRGLEHGFTLHERPEGTSDHLSLTLNVRGTLTGRVEPDGRTASFSPAGNLSPVVSYSGLKVWDATGKELPALFEMNGSCQLRIVVDDQEARYPVTVDPWIEEAYLKATIVDSFDYFSKVAIDGDRVVVGATGEASNGSGPTDNSAAASGAAYVFVRNGTTWTQEAYLKASYPEFSDLFGVTVAIDGDTVAVGATSEDGDGSSPSNNSASGAGAVYVFVRSGGTWTQQAYLKSTNIEANDNFGNGLDLDGDTLIVGAMGEDGDGSSPANNGTNNSGAAYIFTRSGSTWTQQAYLKAATIDNFDSFGNSVSISGDTAVVGVASDDGLANSLAEAGTVYVFTRSGSTWTQQARLYASNAEANDNFGKSVDIDGDLMVVGANGEDSNGSGPSDNSAISSGAAYVFARSGGTWTEEAYLKGPAPDANDGFGAQVSISGETIVVGALSEDSDGSAPTNNGLSGSGAAFVFSRSSGSWTQTGYLKASNRNADDYFGGSVGISGSSVVVGATGEQGDGTNGPSDNSKNFAGAVYVFTLPVAATLTGTITPVTGSLGPGGSATVTMTLSNSSGSPTTTTVVTTVPAGATIVNGSCSDAGGSCTFTAAAPNDEAPLHLRRRASPQAMLAQTVTWTGTIPANGSITFSFQVQIGSQASAGTQYCLTTTVGGSPGPSICLTLTVPPSGPGTLPLAAGLPTQQKPGSVLIYNLYTSGIDPARNDTRITLTNTNPVNSALAHLFFVDGSNCSVADLFVTLTQNQTVSLLASDIDPGVTGYLVVVATDESGCPTVQNDLLGEALVKFESGHMANLPAIGIAGLGNGTIACNPNSPTATLAFDGVSYNELPRTLAFDSLDSRATGNSTMLVINRLGGDLTSGAAPLGSLAGLLFDDTEASQSFTLPGGTCQLRGILGNNFPRTAPRYDNVIPAGRTGWMKLWPIDDAGISGVMINEATVGFSQGHNLHALTTTSSVVFTIPVFPAR